MEELGPTLYIEIDEVDIFMIIKTKLIAPTVSSKIVYRKNFSQKMQLITDYKLVMITAPAGFGKTTSVAANLQNNGILHAWLSLDEDDNDPVKFWKYVIAALEYITGSSDALHDIPVNKETISSGMLAGLLIDQLYAIPGNVLIVLDDYHLIYDELIQKSLAYFLNYLPHNITVIILSRTELDYSLTGKYARGKVLKIGPGDLSFNSEETAEFFTRRGIALRPDDISILQEYTEGWVTGLVVAALSIESSPDPHAAVRQFSGHNRYIDSFISNEIFNNWPDEIKEFLIQTSFLDKLCGSLCGSVTGNINAAGVLKGLAEGNSLLLQLDSENQWFRYHHLFREFLTNKLNEKSLDFRRKLYQKAGEWYKDNGLQQEAIEAYLKAEAYLEAFSLLVDPQIYLQMSQSGELYEWCKLATAIPEGSPAGFLKEKIQTFCAIAWALSMDDRLKEANTWIDKAQEHFEQMINADEKEKLYLQAHIDITRVSVSIAQMDIEKVQHYFKRLVDAELYQPILLGEINPGAPTLLNSVYGFRGRLNQIYQSLNYLIADMPKIIGDFSAYGTIIMAECLYERNELEEAYQTIINGMDSIIELNNPGAIVPCFIILARLKRARGDMSGAFNTIAAGRNKINGKNKAFWNYYFDIITASLFIDLQDINSAEEWLDTNRISIYDNLSSSREYEYIVFARYLTLQKKYDDALLLLTRLEAFAEKENHLAARIRILALLAFSHYSRGDLMNAMLVIDKALELGREEGYVRTFIDELEPMEQLLTEYRSWNKRSGENEKYLFAKTLSRLSHGYVKEFRAKNPITEDLAPAKDMAVDVLSPREYKVLRLLVAERSNKEIAEELGITVRTVKYHNSQIFDKLSVNNRLEAIIMARESGLLN